MISAQEFTYSIPSLSLGVLVISTIAWLIWTVLLYPKVSSPLRRFPGPKVSYSVTHAYIHSIITISFFCIG